LETHTTLSGVGARPMRPLRPRRVAPGSEPAPVAGGSAFWAAVLGPALPADVVAELQELAQVRELPAGSLLVSSREPARDLCLIARGDAALGSAPADGSFQPERSVQGPAWLDASSAWLGAAPAQDAVAVSDVTLVSVPRADVQALMQRHPELARRLVGALGERGLCILGAGSFALAMLLLAWSEQPWLAVLACPTRELVWMIWRCRLDRLTVSWSMMPMVPTPAAAR
jgi:hypothetical protein